MLQRADQNKKFVRVQYAETRLEPIWDALVAILKDPANVIPKLEEYTFKNANAQKAQEKIRLCEKQIEALERQRARVVQVFMDGAIYEKEYKEHLDDCNSRILSYQNQKTKYQQILVKREERHDRDEILKKLYKKIQDRLDNPTYEDKQYIVHLFIERINLFHRYNYAEVFFRFPVSLNVKTSEDVKVAIKPDDLRLVLHVKTLSETERRREIMFSNVNHMYKKTEEKAPLLP